MYANALALAFALAPTAPTDRAPPFDVSVVEVQQTDSSARVTAYDADGEVAAELAVWVDSGGRKHVDANFPDGLFLNVAIDGENVTVDSDNRAEVAARAQAINDWLAANEPQADWHEWAPCAIHAGFAVFECAVGGPLGCGVGGVLAACECLPLFTDVDCV